MYDSIQNIYVKYACVDFYIHVYAYMKKNAKDHYGNSFHLKLGSITTILFCLLFTLLISISQVVKNCHVLCIYYIFKWIKYIKILELILINV